MRFVNYVTAVLIAILVTGCYSGGGSSSGVVAGNIEFVPGSTASIVVGDTYEVVLDLVGSSGVVGKEFVLAVADTSVAEIARPVSNKCYLSSGSISASECTIQLRALLPGRTTTLTASAAGYDSQTLNIVTTARGTVTWGNLSVLNGSTDGSQYVTTTPVNLTYASGGSQLSVSAKILGSSGVTGNTTITFTPASGTATPSICSVTTSNPVCNTTISGLPTTANASTAIQVTASSAQGDGHNYNTMVVNAIASGGSTSNGKIMFETQSGQQDGSLPNGMSGPLFLWAQGNGKTDTVTVNLTVTNADGSPWTSSSPISLYYYPAGNNTTPTYVGATPAGSSADRGRAPSCTLTFNTDGKFYSCGYGIAATQSSGSVIITPSYTSANGYTYTAEPVTVTAIANDTFARTTTFNNNLSGNKTIWLGIQNSTANAYVSPTVMATQANSSSKVYCGADGNNFAVACPTGSQCKQGGAYPGGSTTYQCFWDVGTVTGTGASSFAITSGNPLVHNVNAHSYAPGSQQALNGSQQIAAYNPTAVAQWSPNAIWGGNFVARTGCNTTTGTCVVGSCTNTGASNPMVCPPGVNFTNALTLSEITFQRYDTTRTMMDTYDVSVIAGANVTSSFGPNPNSIANLQTTTVNGQNNASAYYCGTPGASVGQSMGVLSAAYNTFDPNAGLSKLPQNPWTMGVTAAASFPPGVSMSSDDLAKSNYRLVDGGSGALCPAGTCSGSEVCGLTMTNIQNNSYSLTCGNPHGWITPNQFGVLNSSQLNPNFFTVSSGSPNYWTASGTNSILDYQQCSGTTFSANDASDPGDRIEACGGVVWGTIGSSGQQSAMPPVETSTLVYPAAGLSIINASSPVLSSSSNWLNYVLPTILWLKQACPTCYTFPYDDPTSTFSCAVDPTKTSRDFIQYQVNFGDLPMN